eukprot:scaffold23364_cov129-Isochrysis_galbana.AAC.3
MRQGRRGSAVRRSDSPTVSSALGCFSPSEARAPAPRAAALSLGSGGLSHGIWGPVRALRRTSGQASAARALPGGGGGVWGRRRYRGGGVVYYNSCLILFVFFARAPARVLLFVLFLAPLPHLAIIMHVNTYAPTIQ